MMGSREGLPGEGTGDRRSPPPTEHSRWVAGTQRGRRMWPIEELHVAPWSGVTLATGREGTHGRGC